MFPVIGDRQRCAIAGLLLALALPGFGASRDATGVAVFGSYLNAINAEREAELLGERLGMALAVTRHVVDDGTVFYRVVSGTMPEREVRELIARVAEQGQDAWFAERVAPVSTGLESMSPLPPKTDTATLVEAAPVVADDSAIAAVESQGSGHRRASSLPTPAARATSAGSI